MTAVVCIGEIGTTCANRNHWTAKLNTHMPSHMVATRSPQRRQVCPDPGRNNIISEWDGPAHIADRRVPECPSARVPADPVPRAFRVRGAAVWGVAVSGVAVSECPCGMAVVRTGRAWSVRKERVRRGQLRETAVTDMRRLCWTHVADGCD
jgi:hypothetical protein